MESKWKIYRQFERFGRLLFQQGLVSLTAGNLSVRSGEIIYITASGSMLGDLKYEDIVSVALDEGRIPGVIDLKKPSMEIIVHRSIYKNTDYKAIAHVHNPSAIAVSFKTDKVELADSEGRFYIPHVPVVAVNGGIASEDVAKVVPSILKDYPAVIVRSHGVFAAADTLDTACSLASTIEFSSGILMRIQKNNMR
ncbi:class II aldolase/adducin family protein [Elusimicrobiota bacterium]